MSTKPSDNLLGLTLNNGWVVEKQLPNSSGGSGGNFSSAYIVKRNNETAFLKALDYTLAFGSDNPALALQELTSAYLFEKAILEVCNNTRMTKVVSIIDSGKVSAPNTLFTGTGLEIVEYLIFELAEHDARKKLDMMESMDIYWILKSLQHIATGLQQLHKNNIAHQDLKPSNVLIFSAENTNNSDSKIADFGRSSAGVNATSSQSPFDGLIIAGDRTYAPIEQLYGYVDPEWSYRRIGCDAYHFGSLIVFYFTRTHMTALLKQYLAPEHLWIKWAGTYIQALPYVLEAFDNCLSKIESEIIDKRLAPEIVEMVRFLCNPDVKQRGHPKSISSAGNSLSMERFVAKLDLLSRKYLNNNF